MIILKIIGKAAVLPIMLFLIVIPWIGIFLNHISGVIFGLLSGIIVLTGIASLLYELTDARRRLRDAGCRIHSLYHSPYREVADREDHVPSLRTC